MFMDGRVARRGGVFLVSLALMLTYLAGAAAPAQAVAALGDPADGWRPTDGTVYAVERVGDTVVLGGDFTTLVNSAGQKVTRHGLAAISASTGDLQAWAPNPNGQVRALEGSADERSVYVGGEFTSIGTAARTNLAAISLASGRATSFRPGAFNHPVHVVLLRSGTLYIGGTFWKIGTVNRGFGAAVDPATGALKSWDPKVTNNGIFSMVVSPDRSGIIVGGPFTKIHGVARPYLAKVTAGSGSLVNWRWGTSCNSSRYPCHVLSLAADSKSVYAGIAGPGGRLEAIHPATGTPRWATSSDGDVQSIAVVGDTVYAGGHFKQTFGDQVRAGLAAVNTTTGRVQPDPSFLVKGTTVAWRGVWSVLVDNGVLRIGGQFTTVNGAPLEGYAAFRMIDRTPPSRPGTPSAVTVLTTSVQLGWAAASDDLGGAVHYRIYRDGQRIGEARSASYQDTGLVSGRTYRYAVAAVDATGNEGDRSNERAVTTGTGKAVTVKATRAGYGNVLSIDVNPDRGTAAYKFTLQKLSSNKTWVPQTGVYSTYGAAETRSLTLAKGSYRVYVLGGNGYAPALSSAVTITDPTVKVVASRNSSKTKLTVNVNPNKGSGYWSFKVQKRTTSGTWTTLSTTYRTLGSAETRTLDLKKGTYRVVVSAKYGYRGAVSNAVVLAS
jgi:hypothetical protein